MFNTRNRFFIFLSAYEGLKNAQRELNKHWKSRQLIEKLMNNWDTFSQSRWKLNFKVHEERDRWKREDTKVNLYFWNLSFRFVSLLYFKRPYKSDFLSRTWYFLIQSYRYQSFLPMGNKTRAVKNINNLIGICDPQINTYLYRGKIYS